MGKFEFYSVGRVVCGRGVFSRAGELAGQLGGGSSRTALVVSNGSAGLMERLAGLLDAAGLKHVLVRQKGEPTVRDVDAALATARQSLCDRVIGIGGGSAMDAAKAVAGLLSNGGGVTDYMEVVGKGQKITKPAVPWMAVPCTAGTGAEVTRNAVIGYPEKHFKASLRSELLLASVALIDPELAVDVRPEVTARTGMDALCQCIEAYTSNGATAMTDPIALEGVGLAAGSLERAYLNGADLEARERMAMAALFSGMALTNAGLGAVHGFAAPLGAAFPVPHGTVCAALLAPVMEANVGALRAAGGPAATAGLARYASIGRKLVGRAETGDENAIEDGIGFVKALCGDLQIPQLRQFGIGPADVAGMVALAQKSSSMRFNPVLLPAETLHGILISAL
jgi:alcohol dehydrogenase class IV